MPISRKGREFARRTKLDAFERAGGCCEHCHRKLYPGDRIEYDHIITIEQGGDNSLANAQVLCGACHARKSGADATVAAKGRAVRAKHIGAAKPKRPMPGSRASRFKKRLDGSVVPR